jgi:hypothetical protein
MKKLILVFALFGLCAIAKAEYTLDADSRRVTVSTIPTSATQLFTASEWGRTIGQSWILNDSSFNLAISPDTNITTNTVSGLFYIPASTLFDLGEYRGALYGVIVGTTVPQSVGVLRKK